MQTVPLTGTSASSLKSLPDTISSPASQVPTPMLHCSDMQSDLDLKLKDLFFYGFILVQIARVGDSSIYQKIEILKFLSEDFEAWRCRLGILNLLKELW